MKFLKPDCYSVAELGRSVGTLSMFSMAFLRSSGFDGAGIFIRRADRASPGSAWQRIRTSIRNLYLYLEIAMKPFLLTICHYISLV